MQAIGASSVRRFWNCWPQGVACRAKTVLAFGDASSGALGDGPNRLDNAPVYEAEVFLPFVIRLSSMLSRVLVGSYMGLTWVLVRPWSGPSRVIMLCSAQDPSGSTTEVLRRLRRET